jgi:hypothetical protein
MEPDHPVRKKLEEIHEDVKDIKDEFKTVHDRMDREVTERHWSLIGILQAIKEVEQRVVAWFRRP